MQINNFHITGQGELYVKEQKGLTTYIEFNFVDSNEVKNKLILQYQTIGDSTVYQETLFRDIHKGYGGREYFYPKTEDENIFLREKIQSYIKENNNHLYLC